MQLTGNTMPMTGGCGIGQPVAANCSVSGGFGCRVSFNGRQGKGRSYRARSTDYSPFFRANELRSLTLPKDRPCSCFGSPSGETRDPDPDSRLQG